MRQVKEAKRYAKSLLDAVGIESAPQAITEMNAINDLMVKSREFRNLLANPQFTLEEKENVLKQIAEKMKLSDKVKKFVINLTEIGLVLYLSEIVRIATNLYFERKKKAKAIVKSPIEVSKDFDTKLRSSLKQLTDREVDIEYEIDPSLLGGILVKVGSTMYDTSIIGQLRLLKNELIKG